jgi:hypothetical protein
VRGRSTVVALMTRYFFLIHQGLSGKTPWRWRLSGPAGRLVAVSGAGYATQEECVDAVNALAAQTHQPQIRLSSAV